MRYIAAAVPQTRAYAPNLVVVRTPLGADEDPGAVLVGSGRAIVDAIPGVRMIDECPAEHLREGGRLRSGIYILDETAPDLHAAGLDPTDPQRGRLFVDGDLYLCHARVRCPLRHMYEMSQSLEVVA